MAPKMDHWCKAPEGINDSQWIKMNSGVNLQCEVRSVIVQDNGSFYNASSEVKTEKCHEWEYDHSFHTRTLTEEVGQSKAILNLIDYVLLYIIFLK